MSVQGRSGETVVTGDDTAVRSLPDRALVACRQPLERVALAIRRSALALAYRSLPAVRLEGHLAGGTSAGLVLIGASPALAALAERLLPWVERRHALEGWPLATIPWRVDSLMAAGDLVAARVEQGASALLGRGALCVPELVDAVLALPGPGERLRLSASARNNAGRARRAGLGYSISRRDEDLDLFVRRYYRPHMAAAHGARAAARSAGTLRAAFHRGGLLWVERGQERLAGLLFAVEGPELAAVALGVRDGDLSLRELGASFCCNLFALEHARLLGLERLDLGGSLAWLADPVLQAKRFLGVSLRLRRRATHDLLLWWPAGSAAAATLVRELAPIHRGRRDRLAALTDGDPGGLERLRPAGLSVSHVAAPGRNGGRDMTPLSRAVAAALRWEDRY